MTSKKKSQSQQQWLRRQHKDKYVKSAKEQGYAGRAVFKLKEIQEKDQLFSPGMSVVDLGAAPGSWSQIVADWVGGQGKVWALDILPMDAIAGVTFLQGDFTSDEVYQELLKSIDKQSIDLVISDMAPNMSGMRAADQARAIYLCELALEFCEKTLRPGGAFVVKVFQGVGFNELVRAVRLRFKEVKIRKPQASRQASREQYIVAKEYNS